MGVDSRDAPPAWRRDARGAAVLVRAELRARARSLVANRRRLLATAFLALQFAVVFPLFLAPGVLSFGERLASGDPPVGLVGATVGGVLVAGAYGGAATAIAQNRIGSVGPLVRTSLPPPAVTVGRMAGEAFQSGVLVVPPLAAVLVIVGVGAGGPLAPALLGAAALPVLAVGFLAGRAAGAVVRYLDLLARLSTWSKAVVYLVVMVGIFAGTQVVLLESGPDSPGAAVASVPAFLPGLPLQAYASLALAPLGATPRALGVPVAALVVVVIPAGIVAAVRVETTTLHRGAGGDATTGKVESRATPWPLAAAPAGRVAWRYLLRTARDPRMLSHLLPILFGVLGASGTAVSNPGIVIAVGPDAVVVLGAILAGATYGLNPLGDDRDQLPFLLTSTGSTSVLLRGRALAGVVVGLAFAVGVGVPLGLVEGSPALVAARAALAPVVLAAAAGAALGLGALVPRFERREYVNVERAHPSTLAVLGFGFGSAVAAAAGLLLLHVTLDGAASATLLVGVWAAYLVVLAVAGGGGYAYAVRTFDALTLDDT